jgi:hypothetical protein
MARFRIPGTGFFGGGKAPGWQNAGFVLDLRFFEPLRAESARVRIKPTADRASRPLFLFSIP